MKKDQYVDVIHWLVFISLRSLMLHFIITKFSTCSGAVLALEGVTILPATEISGEDSLALAGGRRDAEDDPDHISNTML